MRKINRVVRLGDERSWIEARPASSGRMIVQYELDYGSGNPIGRQSLEILLSPRFFHLNLAPSRTFMLEREAAALQAQGLGHPHLRRPASVRRRGADPQHLAVPR